MHPFPNLNTCTVAIIGLGYVGLPLAVELSKPQACMRTGAFLRRRVIGFDINQRRLSELSSGVDRTKQTSNEELMPTEFLEFTSDPINLTAADVFVVAVPTPINSSKRPDLTALEKASVTVGRALKARLQLQQAEAQPITKPLVIYESTVYPGATEEVCVPILERESGMEFNEDFFCGYSPERINPGDKEHRLTTITKVTSGSTADSASWIDAFYGSIVSAGTHRAPSLKVAEAAKVIENTQRDLNIALVNELAMIFSKIEIDTLDVLEAAGSKWNFLPFHPGLVGGHCIGVDPYYLTHKAEQLGYYPQVVLAGRRINDGMGQWVVEKLVLGMAQSGMVIAGAPVLVLGFTFKENCPDIRNTRVVDMVKALRRYGIKETLVDPIADPLETKNEYGLDLYDNIPKYKHFSAVIAAVAHKEFVQLNQEEWKRLLQPNGVFLDLRGFIPRELNPMRF